MKHNPVVDALKFDLVARAKNRLHHTINSLKSPRNLAPFFLIIVFGFFISQFFPRGIFNLVAANNLSRPHILFMVMLLEILIKLLFSGDINCFSRSLMLKPTDVAFFFAAPLSRRQIVVFRLFSFFKFTLLMSLANAAIGAYLFHSLSFVRMFLGTVVAANLGLLLYFSLRYLISYLAMKRLRYLSAIALVSGIVAIIYSIWQVFTQAQHQFKDLTEFKQTAAFEQITHLFDWMLNPLLSPSWSVFFESIGLPLLALISLGLIFFTRKFPYSFFEQSITGAGSKTEDKQIKTGKKPQKHWLEYAKFTPKLQPIGPQYKAIVWKTIMASPILRVGILRWFAIGFLITLPILSVVSLPLGAQYLINVILVTVVFCIVLIGPWIIKGGLRHDMPYLDLLKSMPIGGRHLMFGSMVVPIAISFVIVMLTTIYMSLITTDPQTSQMYSHKSLTYTLAMFPMLLALIATRFTVHNLWALHLPSVRPETNVSIWQLPGRALCRTAVRLLINNLRMSSSVHKP